MTADISKTGHPLPPQDASPPVDLPEKLAWLRLIRTENIGPISFYNMIGHYGSAAQALAALPDIAARSGRKKPLRIPPLAAIEKEYDRLRKMGGDILCACESDYPSALAVTDDAPPVLTLRGQRQWLSQPALAIVGARNASHNGRAFAAKMAKDLGAAGQVIISGMARGIDTAAHETALPTGTIAVLAGGLDNIYPPENKNLYEKISTQGLLLAENPMGMPARARDFPRRNRIVSGLSAGVIVVEATERSGSLITARLAGEQGRDVYAVPGHPLDPRATGPNRLIRDGAVLVRDAHDVLENLGGFAGYDANSRQNQMSFHLDDSGRAAYEPLLLDEYHSDQGPPPDFEQARALLREYLSFSPAPIDSLIRSTGLSAALVQTTLLEMELAGEACRLAGSRAALIPPA